MAGANNHHARGYRRQELKGAADATHAQTIGHAEFMPDQMDAEQPPRGLQGHHPFTRVDEPEERRL